jgi:Tfp pilus assembly protein FimT
MTPARHVVRIAAHRARSVRRAQVLGLTIIELTVVLIVIGVIVTLLVVPSMSGMIARHRVQGVQAELIGDLQLARSEQARRNGDSTAVAMTFGSSADLTCYTIHTVAALACDCTRAPGDACGAAPGAQEIKTLQFARSVGVTVAAASASGPTIVFSPPQGLVTPTDLVIDVQSATRGQLRTSISRTGVPSVCSPDGSVTGVRTPC